MGNFNSPENRRIRELELFNDSLMRERILRRKVDLLEEESESRKAQMEDLQGALRHVRTMLQSETKSSESLYGKLVKMTTQRDDYRQELVDLHDYVMSGGDHNCDMGPDCPVMAAIGRNPV